MSKTPTLSDRLSKARSGGAPDVTERARRGVMAYVGAQTDVGRATRDLADGTAATGVGRVALSGLSPQGLACADGCAFCCILSGSDGGTITEAEAVALHTALAPLAGQPDGRAWHPKACPSLDPETRSCRAYDARPMICRAYVSTDAEACKAVSEGRAASGPGTLGPYHTYLAAIGLSRAALKGVKRVATYALSKVAAGAVQGASLEDTLAAARHAPSELEAELKRSKRDLSRA
ncbi:MAG: YkgJ family cysteine cluster protein [Rhodobacteraceae bacterium]|nr:YkgJ family cysteine cluster protein [Paracoccaceae bacterium]